METEKITRFNEWWVTKRVKPTLLKPFKRPLFFKLQKYLNNRQILLITGLRRVGKTTIIYQLIQELLDKKIINLNILYFSFDEQHLTLDDLIKDYEEKILRKRIDGEKIYIFLDEIQKLKDWQNKLKIYYDLYPNLKFIISGSASVQISKRAKESLAGRIFDFLLEPLAFKEFLEWKNIKFDKKRIELSQNNIMPVFYDYLRKGGFPEIIHEEEDEKIKNYIRNSVIEVIIYKDLPEEFGILDYDLLRVLIEMVATQPGIIINYDALSRNLHKNKKTIINYLFYLEYSLLIRTIANYRKGLMISSRKLRKAYVTNTAISFALVESFYSSTFLEKIAENFAVIETNAKNYYRNKYEIDLILKFKNKLIPIEVKYGDINTGPLFKSLLELNLKEALILTKEVFDKKILDGKKIVLLPLWAFALTKEDYLNIKL